MIILKYAWKEVRRRKKRSFSTLFGYIIIIAAILVLVNFIIYINKMETDVLKYMGTRLVAYITEPEGNSDKVTNFDSEGEGFVLFTTNTKLMDADMLDKVKLSDVIDEVSPYISYRMNYPVYGVEYMIIGGIDTSSTEAVYKNLCSPNEIMEGRFIEKDEKNVVMLGEAFSIATGITNGDTIIIRDMRFKVIGIVFTEMEPMKADLYMNIDDAYNVINRRLTEPLKGQFNCILISVTSPLNQLKAIDELKPIFGEKGVLTTSTCYRPGTKALNANYGAMYLILAALLISLILFSLKIQHGNVIERHHDMGILKAIGWRNKDIMNVIFFEVIIQAAIGGLIGCGVAVLVTIIVPFGAWILPASRQLFVPISWKTMLLGVIILILCGALAAMVSGLSILNKEPIDIINRN